MSSLVLFWFHLFLISTNSMQKNVSTAEEINREFVFGFFIKEILSIWNDGFERYWWIELNYKRNQINWFFVKLLRFSNVGSEFTRVRNHSKFIWRQLIELFCVNDLEVNHSVLNFACEGGGVAVKIAEKLEDFWKLQISSLVV